MAGSGESYKIEADIKPLEKDLTQAEKAFKKLSESAIQEGIKIDETFRKLGASINGALSGINGKTASLNVDTKPLVNGVNNTERQITNLGRTTKKETQEMDASFKKVGAAIGGYFAVGQIKQFTTAIMNARSEIQKYEVSFSTLLGDKNKATAFFGEIKEYAVNTPLMLKDLASGAQTMLGFNIEAEKVIPTLKQIGDISMGDAQRFQSLTLAFSQMSATGKLMGQDLLQMINAGFNPLAEISQKTGKSISELKDEMSAGKISAEMVADAFASATAEGGKFHGMLEAQSKTMAGALSNLQGAIDDALNSIGQANEELFAGGINALTLMAKNYEKVAVILGSLITTYGAYRVALYLAIEAEKGYTVAQIANYRALLLAEKAQKLLNATMLANPYVAAAVAVGALVTAVIALNDSSTAAERGTKRYNQEQDIAKNKAAERTAKVNELLGVLEDETKSTYQQISAFNELKQEYPDILAKYDLEKMKLEDILQLKKDIAAEDARRAGADLDDRINQSQQRTQDLQKESTYNLLNKQSDAAIQRKLQEEQTYLDELLKERGNKIAETYTTTLDKLDTATRATYVAELQKRIKGKSDNDVIRIKLPIDEKGNLSQEGAYSVQDIKNLIDTTKSLDKAKQVDTKNYKYWEKKKEDAENQLKLLESTKLDTKEAAKLQKEIRDAEAEMEKYNTSKSAKEANKNLIESNKEKVKAAELQQKYNEQQKALARQARDNALDIRSAEIEGMSEGFEKEEAQMNLNYDRLIAANKDREEEMIRQLQEAERTLWEKNNPKADEQGLVFVPTISQVTPEQQAQLDEYARLADEYRDKFYLDQAAKERDAMNEFLIQYGNYQEQRKAIQEKYQLQIARSSSKAEQAMLTEQMNKSLAEVDQKFGKVPQTMADLFADASKKSVSAIQAIIDKYEALVNFMQGTGNVSIDNLLNLGFTQDDIEKVKRGEIQIKDLMDRLKELKGELAGKSPWQSFTKGVTDAAKKIKDGELGEGIADICASVTDFLPALKEFGSSIANIFGANDSAITGMIDGLSGVAKAGEGFGQMLSGDIVGGAMAAVNGISQVVDALDGLFGADYAQYNQLKSEYDGLSEVWDELIDKKRSYIKENYGVEADKVGKEAISIANNKAIAARQLAEERLDSGASIGSHSIGYRMNHQYFNSEDWANARRVMGAGFDNVYQLLTKSGEELQKLKETAPAFWAKMDEDFRSYLQDIIDAEETAKDIQQSIWDQLTATTFDNMYSNFESTLLDMEADSKDFVKSLNESFNKALLSQAIGEKYKEKLKVWYEKFAAGMNKEGGLTEDEMNALRREYQGYVEEAIAQRDAIASMTGYDADKAKSQQATVGAQLAANQDSVNELNGRFTAMQVAMESTREEAIQMRQTMTEVRDVSLMAIDHLENIAKNTAHLSMIDSRLEQIEKNTR